MKKICFVVATPFTANGFLINHLRELSRVYDVFLCLNCGGYPISPQLLEVNLQIIDVPIERKISPMRDLQTWCLLFKIFRQHKFYSVHSLTPKAGLLGMSASFFAGISNRIHTFTGQIWVTRSGLSRHFFKRIDWFIVKFSTFIFADSASQIQFLLKEKICKPSNVGLLGHGSISGVDLLRFKPDEQVRLKIRERYAVQSQDCIFLFVGRLCRDKGIFDLLDAFAKIKTKHRGANLWIVGPDEEDVKSRAMASHPEIFSKIRWFGPTFEPENFMLASDVLVLPSYREGFGSVIIEAAACEVPTVAYQIDGVVDAVEDNKTGLLVSVGNAQELFEAMELLLVDNSLRAKMASAAKSRAINQFSSVDVTHAWLKFYRNLFK